MNREDWLLIMLSFRVQDHTFGEVISSVFDAFPEWSTRKQPRD